MILNRKFLKGMFLQMKLLSGAFKEITNITGIVLTKLDEAAKGGIVLTIKEKVGIPVKFVGIGEKYWI